MCKVAKQRHRKYEKVLTFKICVINLDTMLYTAFKVTNAYMFKSKLSLLFCGDSALWISQSYSGTLRGQKSFKGCSWCHQNWCKLSSAKASNVRGFLSLDWCFS